MAKDKQQDIVCQVCKKHKRRSEVVPAELIREPLVQMIRKDHPDWSSHGVICLDDLNAYRAGYVKSVLETEKGELSALEEQVMDSLRQQELVSENINVEFDQARTFGERVSDRLAELAGSWRFIGGFGAVLFLWVLANSVVLLWRPFDPYPFILLNLLLSCLAAIQAPVIMMSQNRQESRDRLRAEQDYVINLKAELEIRHLHEKLDHLLRKQWERLLEIQDIQLELMEELTRKAKR